MAVIPEETVRKYVRIDEGSDDAEVLASIEEAAEDFVVNATRRSRDELLALGGGSRFPKPIEQAILMITADWYDKRSATTMQQAHAVPLGVTALIRQYRSFKRVKR